MNNIQDRQTPFPPLNPTYSPIDVSCNFIQGRPLSILPGREVIGRRQRKILE